MDGNTRQLLTVFEAENLTGRKAATWRKDIMLGKISSVKIGRQIRIPIDVIEQLIRDGYRPARRGQV